MVLVQGPGPAGRWEMPSYLSLTLPCFAVGVEGTIVLGQPGLPSAAWATRLGLEWLLMNSYEQEARAARRRA